MLSILQLLFYLTIRSTVLSTRTQQPLDQTFFFALYRKTDHQFFGGCLLLIFVPICYHPFSCSICSYHSSVYLDDKHTKASRPVFSYTLYSATHHTFLRCLLTIFAFYVTIPSPVVFTYHPNRETQERKQTNTFLSLVHEDRAYVAWMPLPTISFLSVIIPSCASFRYPSSRCWVNNLRIQEQADHIFLNPCLGRQNIYFLDGSAKYLFLYPSVLSVVFTYPSHRQGHNSRQANIFISLVLECTTSAFWGFFLIIADFSVTILSAAFLQTSFLMKLG